jgi:hypothetical protein
MCAASQLLGKRAPLSAELAKLLARCDAALAMAARLLRSSRADRHQRLSCSTAALSTMRAVVVRELGDASCLTLDEARTVPTLGAGEVLVRNSFAGLNFHDTYTRSGLYPMPRPADFVVGCEGGGVVAHCPAGVACGVKEGDRVVYLQVHLARKPNSLVVSSAHVQPNVWSLCLPACRMVSTGPTPSTRPWQPASSCPYRMRCRC